MLEPASAFASQVGLRVNDASTVALLGMLALLVVSVVFIALIIFLLSNVRASREAAGALLAKKQVRVSLTLCVLSSVLGLSSDTVLASSCRLK